VEARSDIIMVIEPFTKKHIDWLQEAINEGMEWQEISIPADFKIINGKTKDGIMPIGIMRIIETAENYEPHVSWFPWASNKNIYQGFLSALNELTKKKSVLIFARTRYAEFYDGWAKRKAIRKVGVLNLSENIHIYQAKKTCLH